MKTTLIFLVFTMCFLSLSCSKDDEINSREYVTTCYKFVEKGSNVPIVGLSVIINYGSSGILGSQGTTNNEGVWCFQHWNDNGFYATPYTYVLDELFYNFPSQLPLNGSLNTIELIPRSNIKFHLINVEPSSINDKIVVSVNFSVGGGNYDGYGYTREFEGKEIDTFYISNAVKGLNTISWSVYELGILESSYTDEVTIEQYHETIDYEIEY